MKTAKTVANTQKPMNYLQRLIEEIRIVLFITLLLDNVLLLGMWYVATDVWHWQFPVVIATMLFGGLLVNLVMERVVARVIVQPIELLWRNILHLSPSEHGGLIPKLTTSLLGKDLVEVLTNEVYKLLQVSDAIDQTNRRRTPDLSQDFIAGALPLPLLVLDKTETILFANQAALSYFGKEETDLVSFGLQHKLPMTFMQGEVDLGTWLTRAKNRSVTATQTWDGVRYTRAENTEPLRFGMAAFYNKDNPEGYETLLVFFDHTAGYAQFDQDVDFVALAIHELRTPITMLRGYIEALDEDMGNQLTGEARDFFDKLKASSQQLTTFINNTLNVARIEGNQLDIQLHEENWGDIVTSAVEALDLRAAVRGLKLEYEVDKDLPTVGADRFSITEVITNLIDNAIKYSAGKGEKIVIRAKLNGEGMVETTIEDGGVGIAASVVPTLFNKFQRNFHNRSRISGTGLGLYLSKVIVNLHGGSIWVSSKEGKGTTVGFTVRPYASLSEAQKLRQNKAIVRGSQGWIKNHSMSRR